MGKPKVVVIVVDDVGKDLLAAQPVPNLQNLVFNRGRRLNRIWSMPNCSPTRAAIMTGRWPFRTGIGTAMHSNVQLSLPTSIPTMASLRGPTMRSSFVGKWHLCQFSDLTHPNDCGWSTFHGSLGNLDQDGINYVSWSKIINGVKTPETQHATEFTARIGSRILHAAPPELLMLSFHAPHSPLNWPPGFTHPTCTVPAICQPEVVKSMLWHVDAMLGQYILPYIDLEDTYVIFVSDNGSAPTFNTSGRAKGTCYEEGISVPCWIAGPGISSQDFNDLASVADLFSTVLDMCGVPVPSGVDGISLLPALKGVPNAPQREFVFSQRFSPNFGYSSSTNWLKAVREDRWKLISSSALGQEFYDLLSDPGELNPLPLSGPDYQRLSDRLTQLT